ncbi:hypothetical protein B0H14DRAFT_3142455 [Mycena olivaceomarginata]|nr:hypothetical protein B0H14DRAFT_3142455 [Mycena olivaceomarginata]
MYNTQLNGKKSLYISMFENNSCIEEEVLGKCGNGTRRRVSPCDGEMSGRGAWSRKVRRGQGRPHRTGATAAGSRVDPKEPAQKWAGTRAGTHCAEDVGSAQGGLGEQPDGLIAVHKCAGSGKRRRTACACAAHGKQYREHLATLRYAWCMVWAGVISAASRDSERRGRDSKRRGRDSEQRHGSGGRRKVYDHGKCAEARGNFGGSQRAGCAVGDANTLTAGITVAGLGSGDFVGDWRPGGIRMGK